VRSSKCGQIERSFRFNSESVASTPRQHSTFAHLLDTVIYLRRLSVGISIFPEGGRNAEELLRNADTSMYSVKDTGRNSFCALQISEDGR
jgi:GGDEF domain-containing protein